MDYYLGEIRLFPYSRIPSADGWIPCNGQLLPLNTNQALFSLLGTVYGGDGRVNFGVPNLNGRVIVGYDPMSPLASVKKLGGFAGSETVTLTVNNLPTHQHNVIVANSYDAMIPDAAYIGNPNVKTSDSQKATNAGNSLLYAPWSSQVAPISLNPNSVSVVGNGRPHENRMPFLAMVYCIATMGNYPARP